MEESLRRRQAEHELRQSEVRFRALASAVPAPLIVERLSDGQVLFYNRRALAHFGYSAEEADRIHTLDLYAHPEERQQILREVEEQGLLEEREMEYLRKDGTTGWVCVNAAPLDFDGDPALVVCAVDITARKLAEQALQESEEKFRSVVENAPLGIHLFELQADGTLRLVGANPAADRILGIDNSQLLGRPIEEAFPATAASGLAAKFREVARGESELHNDEIEYQDERISGVYENHCFQIAPGRMASLFLDITERKRTEEKLVRDQALLKRLLDLNDRDRQLVAYEIHDGVVQDITGALLFLETARDVLTDDPPRAAKALDEALAQLRDGLVEARRMIDGLRPPVLSEAGLIPALENLATEAEQASGIRVTFHHDVRFGRLAPTIEMAVYRVIQEAITNIQRHSAATEAAIRLTQQGQSLTLEIRDNGRGFDPKTVSKKRFGLEGVRERARVLGGTSLIESQPEAGTRIVAQLPVYDVLE